MSSEETLIQVRREKHQELNGGAYPLALEGQATSAADLFARIGYMQNEGEIKTTIDLAEAKGNGTYTLHGRLSALRKSGALTFLKLTDLSGSIQLVATRNNLLDYERLRLLDLGDIVEVIGEPVLTKTGERSLLIAMWRVLSKSHRPPPEKFVGLVDTELKYRKRHLDLMSSEESRARFVVRSYVLQGIRSYMDSDRFMEVETSTLNAVASGANAKPFTTHHNALDIDLRLRIAPELYLKRLLVGGFEKVYEIGRNYRNEGIDTRHNPEFTMMESYQAYGRFPELITFTKSLLAHVDWYCRTHLPPNALAFYKQWYIDSSFSLKEFAEITMAHAVADACIKAEITPVMDSNDQLIFDIENPNNERFKQIDMKGLLHDINVGEKWAVAFEYLAEPFLTEDYRTADDTRSVPVFVTDFPKEICPLARVSETDPKFCDRFELFVDGRELANAFQELNDPDEQARRFKEQLETNRKDPMDYDADYVEALEHGMPPAIGFGLGVDRLVMLLTNTASIKDVILFPTLRPEK